MAKYEMPIQDTRALGGIPIATKEILGVVRVGNDLNIDIDGALNVNKIDIKSIDDLNTLLNPDYKFLNGTGLKEFVKLFKTINGVSLFKNQVSDKNIEILTFEIGATGQATPNSNLAVGGLFYKEI